MLADSVDMAAELLIPVWRIAAYVSMTLSIVASAWLLRACWRLPNQLFSRQLWHLAAADLAFSIVDPVFELGEREIWRSKDPPSYDAASRSTLHFFLVCICLVELEIAAGIAASALHSVAHQKKLARILPCNWLIATVCAVVDYVTQTDDNLDGNVAGGSPVMAVVMCTTFVLSVVLYIIAVLAVLHTPSPSAVIRRASTRALAYPPTFFITMLPVLLVYMNIVPSSSDSGFLDWCYPCAYSNGFVNAAVYGLQRRNICRRRMVTSPALERVPWERHPSPSFHVGFGAESCVSPYASPTITTATHPSEHSDNEGRLWAPFIATEDSVSTRSCTSAVLSSTRASGSLAPDCPDAGGVYA